MLFSQSITAGSSWITQKIVLNQLCFIFCSVNKNKKRSTIVWSKNMCICIWEQSNSLEWACSHYAARYDDSQKDLKPTASVYIVHFERLYNLCYFNCKISRFRFNRIEKYSIYSYINVVISRTWKCIWYSNNTFCGMKWCS